MDAELVRRGLARSRGHAAELIDDGVVSVAGMPAKKPSSGVAHDVSIRLRSGDEPRWASRGAYKLAGALDAFGPDGPAVAGRRCLDAGAATGGFTDVLLRRGARTVTAVDVGRGLLDWRLRTDERVRVVENTNARYLTPDQLDEPCDLLVADLSFISLRLVVPALAACAAAGADIVPMIKPQFEVGKDGLARGGVVREAAGHRRAVLGVAETARDYGLWLHAVTASPLPGPAGNVEYFAWWRRGGPHTVPGAPAQTVEDRERLVAAAVAEERR